MLSRCQLCAAADAKRGKWPMVNIKAQRSLDTDDTGLRTDRLRRREDTGRHQARGSGLRPFSRTITFIAYTSNLVDFMDDYSQPILSAILQDLSEKDPSGSILDTYLDQAGS